MIDELRVWGWHNQDAIMAGIVDRSEWVKERIERIFRESLCGMIASAIIGCALMAFSVWLPGLLIGVVGATGFVASYLYRTYPSRLYVRWNDDHDLVGMYLSELDREISQQGGNRP